jgi:hypothetical protein
MDTGLVAEERLERFGESVAELFGMYPQPDPSGERVDEFAASRRLSGFVREGKLHRPALHQCLLRGG